jgi:hypothetical protein
MGRMRLPSVGLGGVARCRSLFLNWFGSISCVDFTNQAQGHVFWLSSCFFPRERTLKGRAGGRQHEHGWYFSPVSPRDS